MSNFDYKVLSLEDCIAKAKQIVNCKSLSEYIQILTHQNSLDSLSPKDQSAFIYYFFNLSKHLLDFYLSTEVKFLYQNSVSSGTLRRSVSALSSFIRGLDKIRAVYKGYKQRKKYAELVIQVKYSSQIEKQKKSNDFIIKELKNLVSYKNLTLEHCFRAADKDSDGLVSHQELQNFLEKLNLAIPKSHLAKFISLIDEDCSGTITKEEFYRTLAAYSVQTENQGVSGRTVQQESLLKFSEILNKREIEPEELFNLCDIDCSQSISLNELERYINTLAMGIQQKDVAALMNLLDKNGSGEVTLDEFLEVMNRGHKTFFKVEEIKATEGGNVAETFNVSRVLEIGKNSLFDILDEVNFVLTQDKFIEICKNINSRLTPNDQNNLVKALFLNNAIQVSKAEVEEFCLYYTEIHNLTKEQFGKKVQVIFKRNFLDFKKISEMEQIRTIFELDQIGLALKKYLHFTQSQVRRFLSLFNITQYMTPEALDGLIEPVRPIEVLHRALAEQNLDLESFFNMADKRKTGKISSTDFEITAAIELKNIHSKTLTDLVLLFPLPRLDKTTFLKVFKSDKGPDLKVQLVPSNNLNKDEELKNKAAKRNTLFVHGNKIGGDVLRKFIEQCPPNVLTHEYLVSSGLFICQLLDREKFFSVSLQFKISRMESNEIFRLFDRKNMGLVYSFTILMTLESIRNPYEKTPTQDNLLADPNTKIILDSLASRLSKVPIYKYFQDLGQIVDWSSLFPDDLTDQQREVLSRDFPCPCYYYQLVAVLETYSKQQFVCGELVFYLLIDRGKINNQASEHFQDIPCEAIYTKSSFIVKLEKYMSRTEAESVYQFVYGDSENLPVYHFFTLFDYALSWSRHKLQRSLVLPVKGSEKSEEISDIFEKIAKALDKPLQSYGFSLQDDNSDIGFAQLFERALRVPRNESVKCFRLMKPTTDHRIKLYHIIYVLDSYRPSSVNVTSLKTYFNNLIHEYLPYGATFVISCGQFLSQQIPQSSLNTTFAFMPEQDRSSFISRINNSLRNFVFGFEIACEIDKLQYQAPQPSQKLVEALQGIARNVSAKVLETSESQLKQMLTVEEFWKEVQGYASKEQCLVVWSSLKIESFTKLAFYTFYAELAKFIDFNAYTRPGDIRVLSLCIPNTIPCLEFFSNIELSQLYLKEEAADLIAKKSKVDTNVALMLAENADSRKIGKVFGFEIMTWLDLVKATNRDGKIVSDIFPVPFSSNKKAARSLQQFIKLIANELDYNNTSTFDHFLGLKESKTLTQKNLFAAFPNFPESNVRELFVSIEFLQTGLVFYHLMAVVESYRTKLVQMRPESNIKLSARDDRVSVKEAKLKLKAYILGENPKGRELSSQEIFGIMDRNKDGIITTEEFMSCLDMLHLKLTPNEKIALTKEVDINKDERINYEEILTYLEDGNDEIEIIGLENSLSGFPKDSLDFAIFSLKSYIKNNRTGANSLVAVFLRLDEDKSGGLNEIEFGIAIDRLRLGLKEVHKKKLRDWAVKNEISEVQYRDFFNKVCSYEFVSSSKANIQPQPGDPSIISPKQVKIVQNLEPAEKVEIKKLDPESDFFQKNINKKCTTILNSEDAALARCLQLFSENDRFKDPDFGPEIGQNGDTCLYWTGKPPSSNYPPASEISWKSPKEWLSDSGFIKLGLSSNDVIQGSLGDCWFIGALSVIAQRDELIRGSIEQLTSESQINESNVLGIKHGVYPPLFHCFSRKGLYVFRFFANFAWRWVIIDDRLPVLVQEGYDPGFVFGHCKDNSELWVGLIEKAYAKLFGCYEALNGGLIDDALVDMTGYVAENEKLKVTSPAEAEILWSKMLKYKTDKCLMGCSIDSEGIESDVIIDGEACGLLARHAYAIIDVIQIEDPEALKKRHRLIRLRNPWGQREWQGKWSDNSPEVSKHIEKLQRELKKLGSDEDYNPYDGNDGTFLMCFKDWRTIFHNLYACVDFTDEWWGVRFQGQWTIVNSGGVPMSSSRQDGLNWAKNPQYVLDIKTDTEVFISLSQNDGRFAKGILFPFDGPVKTACFSILKLQPNEEKAKFFDQGKIVELSVLKLHRNIEMRKSLKVGKYVVVPACIKAGMTGEFCLSVYVNCDKSNIDIYCADDRSKGKVIEEEEEFKINEITPRFLQGVKGLVRDITRRK